MNPAQTTGIYASIERHWPDAPILESEIAEFDAIFESHSEPYVRRALNLLADGSRPTPSEVIGAIRRAQVESGIAEPEPDPDFGAVARSRRSQVLEILGKKEQP